MTLSRAAMGVIRDECEAAYPRECCGALIGRIVAGANDVERLHRLRNVEGERPEQRFVVDSGELMRLDRALRAEGGGQAIIGFYHSHPDSPARPSATDLAWAWEDYSYLIVSVEAGAAAAVNSFRLTEDGSETAFAQEELLARE